MTERERETWTASELAPPANSETRRVKKHATGAPRSLESPSYRGTSLITTRYRGASLIRTRYRGTSLIRNTLQSDSRHLDRERSNAAGSAEDEDFRPR